VVRVRELAAVVDDEAACGRAASVRIARAVVAERLIDVGEEGRDRVLDRVGAAERADDAALRRRVLGLLRGLRARALLALVPRPLVRVAPVVVAREELVRVEPGGVAELEDIVRVARRRGPVVQALELERRRIELLNAEVAGEPARDGLPFVARDGA